MKHRMQSLWVRAPPRRAKFFFGFSLVRRAVVRATCLSAAAPTTQLIGHALIATGVIFTTGVSTRPVLPKIVQFVLGHVVVVQGSRALGIAVRARGGVRSPTTPDLRGARDARVGVGGGIYCGRARMGVVFSRVDFRRPRSKGKIFHGWGRGGGGRRGREHGGTSAAASGGTFEAGAAATGRLCRIIQSSECIHISHRSGGRFVQRGVGRGGARRRRTRTKKVQCIVQPAVLGRHGHLQWGKGQKQRGNPPHDRSN